MRKTLIGAALLLKSINVAASGAMAQTNGIEMWYETFGEREGEPLLLNMGYGCSGLCWPTEWCAQLADAGFFVIRYDQRDTGRTTKFDFESNPYDLIDMARDAVALLDVLEIERAHVVGFSMGGAIGQIMAVRNPERVTSLTLMSTSCDFRPATAAMMGLPTDGDGWLSAPRTDYQQGMGELFARPVESAEQLIALKVGIGKMLNGGEVEFDTAYWQGLQAAILAHTGPANGSSHNHQSAYLRWEELVCAIPHAVRVPTLILQGTADPLYGRDHGKALAAAIKGSRLVWVEKMGHYPNAAFYDQWTDEIRKHTGVS